MAGSARVRWGILGPGAIARTFATAVDALEEHEVVATGSRDQERARAFNAERGYDGAEAGTYRQLVRSEAVDAIYVATPHPSHLEHAALALRHGKAVLCEKPLTVNASEARAMCGIARNHGRLLVEAMWSRFLPATRQVAQWLADGAVGEPRRLTCSFGFHTQFDPNSRLYAPELAGGSLLDVGCYTLSLASLVFGEAGLGPEALEVEAELAPSGVDQHCEITLRFAGGAEARLSSSVCRQTDHTAVIEGTEGTIEIPRFWRAQSAVLKPLGKPASLELGTPASRRHLVQAESDAAQTVDLPFLANGYEYQALEVERLLREGAHESPLLPHAESIALLGVMDEIRRRIDVRYPFESAIGVSAGMHRGMSYRPSPIPASGPVSRLILGTMYLNGDTADTQRHADELLDAAFEHGICGLDTAHAYGAGASERAVGSWLERRGLQQDVFVLSKGCHPDAAGPRVTPEALEQDLSESLDRLRLPAVDLYLLHRDDPAVPVGEMVDAFAEHLAAGRIRGYGFSNWTRQRIEEACAYAAEQDRPMPAASSPNFSLADQVQDPWGGGCVSLSGAAAADDRAWHRDSGTAIFAWSSLAHGLFSGRVSRRSLAADPGLVDDACRTAYIHEVNLRRLDRVLEFAGATGASIPQIALAWVLARDLPLHAIVGAATESEVEDLAGAARLTLSADEQRWLQHGGRRPPSMARESLAVRLERAGVRVGRRLPGPIKRPIKRLLGRP